jgi:hypothetical protein
MLDVNAVFQDFKSGICGCTIYLRSNAMKGRILFVYFAFLSIFSATVGAQQKPLRTQFLDAFYP